MVLPEINPKMKMKYSIIAFVSCLIILVASCTDKKKVETEKVINKPLVKAPDFNADSAYKLVSKQVSFGFRIPNTEPHRRCKTWLVAQLKSFGCQVIEQDFTAENYAGINYQLTNIIGQINPKAERRILLAAHWDTRHVADYDSVNQNIPIDGANDGGSGVGVLLEIARVINLAKEKPEFGIDILLLDGEDQGTPENVIEKKEKPKAESYWCLGSQYWARNKHLPNYVAYYGILLDMVGNKNAKFFREGVSMNAAPSIVNKVWAIGNSLGYNQFVNEDVEEIIDDHVFINRDGGIPMIDIIEYDKTDAAFFSNTWHTHQDNMSNIDKTSLKAVGQTVLTTLYQPE
jgi:glutaminyl-peptide cyclotransferase